MGDFGVGDFGVRGLWGGDFPQWVWVIYSVEYESGLGDFVPFFMACDLVCTLVCCLDSGFVFGSLVGSRLTLATGSIGDVSCRIM